MIRPVSTCCCGMQDSGSAYVFRRDLDAPQLHASLLMHICMFLVVWACDRVTVILCDSELNGCSSYASKTRGKARGELFQSNLSSVHTEPALPLSLCFALMLHIRGSQAEGTCTRWQLPLLKSRLLRYGSRKRSCLQRTPRA